MKINKDLSLMLIFVFFLILILGVYHNLPKTFFQQDEWAAFGGIISRQTDGLFQTAKNFSLQWQGVHFLPLTNFVVPLGYHLFGLNFAPYAFLSITLHALNTFLVFCLAYILLKRFDLSLIVGLLFAVNCIFHQPITWIASSFNTQGACLFLLLSLIFLAKEKPLFSILAFALSLGFKETATFLFIFLPIFWLIFARKRDLLSLKKLLIPLFIFGLFYFSLRLFLLLNAPPLPPDQAETLTQPPRAVYLYRLVALPLRAIPQSLISARQIISWAERLVYLAYSHYFVALDGVANPYVVETVAFDLICYLLATAILVFSYCLYHFLKKVKEERLTKGLVFSLSLIATSVLPLILIPGKAGYSSIIEPRHLYITGVGSSLFLTILIFSLGNWLKKKTGFSTYFWVLFLLIPILLIHIKNIRNDINKLVIDGQIRKSILTQIRNKHPILPEEVVFYTESDTAYYGLADEEKILPFQSGFGQTLLVWYHAHGEKFPPCMFADLWLYPIEAQGYQYCRRRGFGYFRKYEDLVQAIKENKLGPENVIAFSWQSEKKVFKDTTLQVREKIKASPSVLGR